MKCVASTHTHTRTRIVLTFSFIETANVRWTKHTKLRFWIVITSAPMFHWNMRFEVKQTGTQNERPRHDENGSKDGKNTYRLKGNLHHLTIQRTHFIFIKAIQRTGHLPPYHPYHCLFNSITFVRKTIKYKSIRLNRNKSFSFCGDLSFICTKEMKKKTNNEHIISMMCIVSQCIDTLRWRQWWFWIVYIPCFTPSIRNQNAIVIGC